MLQNIANIALLRFPIKYMLTGLYLIAKQIQN